MSKILATALVDETTGRITRIVPPEKANTLNPQDAEACVQITNDDAEKLLAQAGVLSMTMHQDKQCKGSVRYATGNPEFPVQSVYVSRTAWAKMPAEIVVVISAK